MKQRLFLGCFLIMYCQQLKCDINVQTDFVKGNCTFVFSNGGYEEFLGAIPLFENCTRDFPKPILFIKFVNYNLPAFPNGTFTNLPYLKRFTLEISKGSHVPLLSPLLSQYSVFKNLKFEDFMIDVSDSSNLVSWNWTVLSEIQHTPIKSFEFIAFRSKLLRLDKSFGKIAGGQVTVVRIINCHLRWLAENVFGPFSNLKGLELYNNLLEKFERSHLPDDASNLRTLDLKKNRLQHLPEDLFHGLKLRQLFLEGNNIKFPSSQVDSIIEVDTLTYIDGGLWPCDCNRLKRLTGRFSNLLSEKCYSSYSTYIQIKIFLFLCKR